jgi:hypothetical protein
MKKTLEVGDVIELPQRLDKPRAVSPYAIVVRCDEDEVVLFTFWYTDFGTKGFMFTKLNPNEDCEVICNLDSAIENIRMEKYQKRIKK